MDKSELISVVLRVSLFPFLLFLPFPFFHSSKLKYLCPCSPKQVFWIYKNHKKIQRVSLNLGNVLSVSVEDLHDVNE